MSKYLTFPETSFKDPALLQAALAALGYSDVEVGDDLTLYGYHGDARPERADLVVRRQHIGFSSNDLGFRKTERGYQPIISEYDVSHLRSKHAGPFLERLKTEYNGQVAQAVARKLRGRVERKQVGKTTQFVVSY